MMSMLLIAGVTVVIDTTHAAVAETGTVTTAAGTLAALMPHEVATANTSVCPDAKRITAATTVVAAGSAPPVARLRGGGGLIAVRASGAGGTAMGRRGRAMLVQTAGRRVPARRDLCMRRAATVRRRAVPLLALDRGIGGGAASPRPRRRDRGSGAGCAMVTLAALQYPRKAGLTKPPPARGPTAMLKIRPRDGLLRTALLLPLPRCRRGGHSHP